MCLSCGKAKETQTYLVKVWGDDGAKIPADFRRIVGERWRAIMQRCYDPSSFAFGSYGGKGTSVEPYLQDRIRFVKYAWTLPNATRFASLEIDRTNTYGDYTRGNIRFVTRKENAENTRTVVKAMWKGSLVPVRDWAREHSSLTPTAIVRNVQRGVSLEELYIREHGPNPSLRPRRRRPAVAIHDGAS